MSDAIRLIDMRFVASHGLLPEEHIEEQEFSVDVELYRELGNAAASDRIEDTADYRAIVDAVQSVLQGPHRDLLETLAGSIVESLSTVIHGGDVIVRVRKCNAPLPIKIGSVEVELRRTLSS